MLCMMAEEECGEVLVTMGSASLALQRIHTDDRQAIGQYHAYKARTRPIAMLSLV
jgi:hypothetical protein